MLLIIPIEMGREREGGGRRMQRKGDRERGKGGRERKEMKNVGVV